MKIKVFEAFAGYGSQAMALQRVADNHPDFSFEVVGISEIEPNAIKAYNAVHGETTNYGDISKIDWRNVPDFDLFTYSFPCQDISAAGLQKGLAEDSGTRSGLLWECKKVIEAKHPKYLLMENVKALIQRKFMPDFARWGAWLELQGYENHWTVMNAKDYGVPQNRERVFMISILGGGDFQFPKPFPLTKRLKDVLEDDVDESFYLSQERIDGLFASTEKEADKGNGFAFKEKTPDDTANTIQTSPANRKTDNYIKK